MSAKKHIGMISGPRNISTTIMRSFENRDDMVVVDEPFYACYLHESGAHHPMREAVMASQSNQWQQVIDELNDLGHKSHQQYVFEKHIAFHFTSTMPRGWLSERIVFLLIRNPRHMIASYYDKYQDVAPILDSLKFQRRLYNNYFSKGEKLAIIDVRDVLQAPENILSKLCEYIDIPFKEAMLQWPTGVRSSDGVWGEHWYDQVVTSTGFRPYVEKNIILPRALETLSNQCIDDYQYLYEKRIV